MGLAPLATAIVALQSAITGSYTIVGAGMPQSSMSMQTKLLPSGQKEVQIRFAMPDGPEPNLKIRLETTYAIDGSQSRIFMEEVWTKPPKRRTVTVSFSSEGAHVVTDQGGNREVKSVPISAELPRANVSQFWFVRDLPIQNEKVVYYHFNATKLEWQLEQAVYMGKKKVNWNGKQVDSHHVLNLSGESFLDGAGLPLRIITETSTYVRKP